LLFSISVTWAQPSTIPHDPELLQKLTSGRFHQIGNVGSDKLGLNAVVMAFSKSGCQLKSPHVSIEQLVKYQRYLTSDADANLAGALLMQVHPLYMETALKIDASGGCDRTWAQTTMRNLFRYLDGTPVQA
jgi:hypothetical protein